MIQTIACFCYFQHSTYNFSRTVYNDLFRPVTAVMYVKIQYFCKCCVSCVKHVRRQILQTLQNFFYCTYLNVHINFINITASSVNRFCVNTVKCTRS